MTQTEQRTRHYGFAMVPRTVIRSKKLTLLERGLYAGIKDICGETGECYYCLRNLAKELGTSISTLSRYIPKLRDAKLINAEKKVRGTAGNKHEVWHIRVVDIWAENDKLYGPQECFIQQQSSVSDRNNDMATGMIVSDRNKVEGESVSSGNKDCFYLNANEYLKGNDTLTNTDTQREEKETQTVSPVVEEVSSSSQIPSFPVASQTPTESPKQEIEASQLFPVTTYASLDEWKAAGAAYAADLRKKYDRLTPEQRLPHKTWLAYKNAHVAPWVKENPRPDPNALVLTPQSQIVWDRWCGLFKKPIPLSKSAVKAAENFVIIDPSTDDLRSIIKYCFDNDNPQKPYYGKKGVQLWDCVREYGNWLSAQTGRQIANEGTASNITPIGVPAGRRDLAAETRAAQAAVLAKERMHQKGA